MKTILMLLSVLLATTASASVIESTAEISFSDASTEYVEWKGISLESGRIVSGSRIGQGGWDLRLKQGYVSTNQGSATKITGVEFDSVVQAPADRLFSGDANYDPMGPADEDTYNRPLMDWYEYFFVQGHLLAPKPFIYVIKTQAGNYAKIQFLDYVKNGQAIRSVTETDFLGRRVTVRRGISVGPADGQVHITIKYSYNDEPGDRSL